MVMNHIAFDTETHPFANGQMAPKPVCLQTNEHPQTWEQSMLFTHDWMEDPFEELITHEANIAIGQNTAFDMTVMGAEFPRQLAAIFAAYEAGRVQCTRTRERLLDMAKGETGPHTRARGYYSMDALVERRGIPVVVDKSNPWRVRYRELEDISPTDWPQEALDYARMDPFATRLIFESQAKEAVAIGYDGFEEESARQASYDFALRLMTCWGVRTDPAKVRQLIVETEAALKELTPKMVEGGILRKDGSKNMKALRERVEAAYNALGKKAPKTPTGAVQTGAGVIEECEGADPVLDVVIEHARFTKVKTTYAEKLLEGVTGNIHGNFHTLGADTGRSSSSEPNLQNQPRKGGVRECFVPREGFVFISADYDSQELRTLAQACMDILGHSALAERYQEDPDFDPHTAFAAELMGITYAEAMERKRNKDEELKERRQQSKAANFGFPGGLGAKNFLSYAKGYGVNIDLDGAKHLRDRWFTQWPEMNAYFDHVKRVADGGTLVQLRSNRRRGGVGFCDGANSYFQGLASDASKTAVFLVSKACYAEPDSPLYGSRPVMLVHDELVLEVPEQNVDAAAKELTAKMVLAMKMWCPDVPARATPVASRCWSKEAEPIYNEEGKLIPWEPKPKEKSNAS